MNPPDAKMIQRIPDIFSTKDKTLSFEFFPPKSDRGYEKLLTTIGELSLLKPDYISCTYGAGGGSREKTFEICETVQENFGLTAMAHLTCVCHTKDEIRDILQEIHDRGIRNILALRGDPPKDNPDWKPTEKNFHYSSELAAYIRGEYGNHFGIGVAGFPEGHILCPDREKDAGFLKTKIDAGADFVITQLFFTIEDYLEYIGRLRRHGILNRVLPGILPVTNYEGLLKFCAMCGATVTSEVRELFAPLADDREATFHAGIAFAVRQCQSLLEQGAPGLHFYCLNKVSPVKEIIDRLRSTGHLPPPDTR